MSLHAAVIEPPVPSVRPIELALTGLQGRRARRRSDFRAELRNILSLRSAARHRETFIPLNKANAYFD